MVWRGGVAEGSGEVFEMRVLIELSMAWFSWLRHILIMGAHREPTDNDTTCGDRNQGANREGAVAKAWALD